MSHIQFIFGFQNILQFLDEVSARRNISLLFHPAFKSPIKSCECYTVSVTSHLKFTIGFQYIQLQFLDQVSARRNVSLLSYLAFKSPRRTVKFNFEIFEKSPPKRQHRLSVKNSRAGASNMT